MVIARGQGRINWTRGPGQSHWPRGPQNAQHNCVAFHMPAFQLCRSTGQKPQNWYDLAAA